MRDAERSFRLPAGPLRDAVEKMADQQVDDIVRSLTKGDESQQGARVQFYDVPWNEHPSITEDTPRLAPNPCLRKSLEEVEECLRKDVGNECRCPECVEREVANAESLGAAQQERGL